MRARQDWLGAAFEFRFGLCHAQSFALDRCLDHRVRGRFLRLWQEKQRLPPEAFRIDSPRALAV